MSRRRVQAYRAEQFYVIDDEATPGAIVGKDLWLPDGTLVTAAMIINPDPADESSRTRWSSLVDIPENLTGLAALAGTGIVVRTGAGTFGNRLFAASADFSVSNGDGVAGNIGLSLSFTVSAFAKTFLDDANGGAVRATIGAEATVAAGTVAQYYRGDKSWQTLNKGAVGLGNVDNTSDAAKPISVAQAAVNATIPVLNASVETIASGTPYTITTVVQAIDFGTVDPALVIPAAGVWMVTGWVQVDSVNATIGTTQSLDIRVRRTNNTAADLSQVIVDLPALSGITHTVGLWQLPISIYVTLNANDAITLFAGLSTALGGGSLAVVRARISAVRLS